MLTPIAHQGLCIACRLPLVNCVCAWASRYTTPHRFTLLMHACEYTKPTNTGYLLTQCLANVETVVWQRGRMDPRLSDLLANPAYRHCLVYPDQDKLSEPVVGIDEDLRPSHFVLLDGTWQQAAKMYRQSHYLHELPRVTLRPEHISSYLLRRRRASHYLCTFEAACALLDKSGASIPAQAMLGFFQRFQHHYLASRNNHAVKESVPV